MIATAPNRVILKKLHIKNFGPIKEDVVDFEPFTYFIGRNNAGKSHYLRAVEILLSAKNPTADEIFKLQHNKSREITIEGIFEGAQNFTQLITKSNHKSTIDDAIQGGQLRVVRKLHSVDPDENNVFGVYDSKGTIVNPTGFSGNLLKVLPDPISIVATADTIEELKSRGNTAIMKLKQEVLGTFLEQLQAKTKEAFVGLDEFLHSQEEGKRSSELTNLESALKSELEGEFAEIVPMVEFELPDAQVITKEMRLILDDGHKSEVEQKGHGLQRATLLALLRVLARQGGRYRDRPAPIFLVGELETFLHPYAQRQLAYTLSSLVTRYQVLTTTHSPFIVSPENAEGYRRVKKGTDGTKNVAPRWDGLDVDTVKRHLEWRGNLEGLFADRLILIEGTHDENCYEKLRKVFGIPYPPKKFTLFVKTNGRKQLRVVRNFYLMMGFDDVAVVGDLDCIFCVDAKLLLEQLGIDSMIVDSFRSHIGWTRAGDPSMDDVLRSVQSSGLPAGFDELLSQLEQHRIFIIKHGAPDHYYKKTPGQKNAYLAVETKDDLLEPDYLKGLIQKLLS